MEEIDAQVILVGHVNRIPPLGLRFPILKAGRKTLAACLAARTCRIVFHLRHGVPAGRPQRGSSSGGTIYAVGGVSGANGTHGHTLHRPYTARTKNAEKCAPRKANAIHGYICVNDPSRAPAAPGGHLGA